MARHLYSLKAAEDYIRSIEDAQVVIIPGSLIDNYIILHPFAIETLEEVYRYSWSSAYTRHIYRKRKPQGLINWISAEILHAEEEHDFDFAEELKDARDYIETFFQKGDKS